MTNQEAFDIAARHLLKQRRKSYWGGACAYRDGYGLKCAVGCLIPDELYKPEMECSDFGAGLSVAGLCEKYPEVAALLEGVDMCLLNDLQNCHDAYLVKSWHANLGKIADRYHLSPVVLGEFPEEVQP